MTQEASDIELREDGSVQVRLGTSEGLLDLIFTDEEQFYKFTAGQHRDAAHKIIRKQKQRLELHYAEGVTVRQLHRYLSRFVDKMPNAPVSVCIDEIETHVTRIVGATREGDNSILWLKMHEEMTNVIHRGFSPEKSQRWSILYAIDDGIHVIGPFDTEAKALAAAKQANDDREFNILDVHVYLMCPNHQMIELSEADLDATTVLR